MNEKEYTSTLHLPKTDFQMKANLPNKEPKYIEKWTKEKIYEKTKEMQLSYCMMGHLMQMEIHI